MTIDEYNALAPGQHVVVYHHVYDQPGMSWAPAVVMASGLGRQLLLVYADGPIRVSSQRTRWPTPEELLTLEWPTP